MWLDERSDFRIWAFIEKVGQNQYTYIYKYVYGVAVSAYLLYIRLEKDAFLIIEKHKFSSTCLAPNTLFMNAVLNLFSSYRTWIEKLSKGKSFFISKGSCVFSGRHLWVMVTNEKQLLLPNIPTSCDSIYGCKKLGQIKMLKTIFFSSSAILLGYVFPLDWRSSFSQEDCSYEHSGKN